ncbi:conserved hypothetical protein [Caldicellulosiruptor hydrothermalis 108]|uniref:Uncharacterized protein n=1 Tax=Caldicellulosiruptor hydrothermalis (strain DSM 18901 / VKM B-2411 / 108) TaxID=632292 RepID=E4QCT0_CALH1|nr:hypothetical protein [Caldicellulosiruptor hydrothermalis]ADQ06299.1 conserved hypothetical protein [Caldicellulosiruptor hydrothermalis 108]
MREKFGKVYGIITFTELLLFFGLVLYIQLQTHTYSIVSWILICTSLSLIVAAGYVFGILPIINEFGGRVKKIEDVLKILNKNFEFSVEDDIQFENSLQTIQSKLHLLEEEREKENFFISAYKEMIIRNVQLIYEIAAEKRQKEIEGLARSLLDMLETSVYSNRIFVPLWYEVTLFQTILSGCIYSLKNNFEIVVNFHDDSLKERFILHGTLSFIAKLFTSCSERQLPIKSVIQLSIFELSGMLNIRIYYNDVIKNYEKIEEVMNILKNKFALYYPEGTYLLTYSTGDNHFVIEMTLPEIKSFES